jgi:hypothetical protein
MERNQLTWQEAVANLIATRNNHRMADLTDDTHPDHDYWRRRAVEIVTGKPIQASKTAISTGNGGITTIPSSEVIQLTKEMNLCPSYQKESNCGCGLARCLAGKGKPDINETGLVNNWDCFHCLRPDNPLYAQHAYKL